MTLADKAIRLSKLAREFNVGVSTLVEYLHKKGHSIPSDPNAKVGTDIYQVLAKEFGAQTDLKKESQLVSLKNIRDKRDTVSIDDMGPKPAGPSADSAYHQDEVLVKNLGGPVEHFQPERQEISLKVTGKVDLDALTGRKPPKPDPKPKPAAEPLVAAPSAEPTPAQVPLAAAAEQAAVDTPPMPAAPPASSAGAPAASPAEQAIDPRPIPAPEPPIAAEPGQTPPEPPKENGGQQAVFRAEVEKLSGLTVVGKIDLDSIEQKRKALTPSEADKAKKKRRKRIKKDNLRVSIPDAASPAARTGPSRLKLAKPAAAAGTTPAAKGKKKRVLRQEVNEEDVQKQIKETLARLTSKGGKSKGAKYRRERRVLVSARQQEASEREAEEMMTLRVTEFVSVSELASMMSASPMEVIEVCMNLGLMVSINQRLDAETMALVADEFGFKVEFVSVDIQEAIGVEEDRPEDLQPRPPIVTVMGHVDHGKTSLLDFVRRSNVIAGEAGGITQHIGAYSVTLDDGKQITFLDTPGHEAFTAMRARGAKITDVAIIVVAADDNVMPQTIEAINHASAAGVPIVFAINKIDKPSANPEKIKETLAGMNYLVEDWGGKYQSQDISAKSGINIDKLLEKVLLEAELLDLKANPSKRALGTVIESSLDKGRGYTATVLVQAGTLRQGDIVLAGIHSGHVKAMFNERGRRIQEAGPSTPVQVIGLGGAPLPGDYFNVMESDRDARSIAGKREQLQRMQGLRAQKHITLDEIGRRIAIGNFQELNIVVKGDVDGSIEALSDSLIKLTTEQIQVNVIHKAVGQISESDILLAAASNAIVVGFQVRPSTGARKLAEKEQIDIRLYSIIYDAINEVKAAMEGMLSPEIKEEVLGTAEVLELFRITKVGTVAGCIVREGKIQRNAKCRVIRDGIVVYTGDLGSLKRFKEDTREVANGFECGLNVNNFNDVKVGDLIESFHEVEVMRKL